jgi:hypothetical protein
MEDGGEIIVSARQESIAAGQKGGSSSTTEGF